MSHQEQPSIHFFFNKNSNFPSNQVLKLQFTIYVAVTWMPS